MCVSPLWWAQLATSPMQVSLMRADHFAFWQKSIINALVLSATIQKTKLSNKRIQHWGLTLSWQKCATLSSLCLYLGGCSFDLVLHVALICLFKRKDDTCFDGTLSKLYVTLKLVACLMGHTFLAAPKTTYLGCLSRVFKWQIPIEINICLKLSDLLDLFVQMTL